MNAEADPVAVPAPPEPCPVPLWRRAAAAYAMRWKRRRLLWRAIRKRRELVALADRSAAIRPGDILAAVTVRNESVRLPFFLTHYRRLGVAHFLFVDNGSDDGSRDYLAAQPDVSLWTTAASYRLSRFGLDWLRAESDGFIWLPWESRRPSFQVRSGYAGR